MSEAETTNVEARKKRDNSRLRKIAIRHAAFAPYGIYDMGNIRLLGGSKWAFPGRDGESN